MPSPSPITTSTTTASTVSITNKPHSHSRSRSRSRSRSPCRLNDSLPTRRRSPAPPRRPRNDASGFRWKQQQRDDNDRGDDDRGLKRGYRAHDQGRDRDNRDARDGGRRDERDRLQGRDRHGRRQEDRPGGDRRDERRDAAEKRERREMKDKPKASISAPAPATASGEPMIIVTVNDRLGTKAQIPCLASDPVKVFKAMVAARIGRPAHEIMLKRQGERPFKDQLTLEDYGVSNGVQLDLELDTGD